MGGWEETKREGQEGSRQTIVGGGRRNYKNGFALLRMGRLQMGSGRPEVPFCTLSVRRTFRPLDGG